MCSNVSPPHPHPSIHTQSHPHPSIYAVCKFPNAHKSGKATVGTSMPTLYAHTHIHIDHTCILIIFVTCNAFYIRNGRTDMDSSIELVESLRPMTASLRSWPIWVYFSAHGRQKNAKKACNATCCAGTVLEAGTLQRWIISWLAMRATWMNLLSAWACSGRSCVFSWKALQREPQHLLQGEPDWIVVSEILLT